MNAKADGLCGTLELDLQVGVERNIAVNWMMVKSVVNPKIIRPGRY